MKKRIRFWLWKVGITTRAEYDLLLRQVTGLSARISEMRSMYEARKQFETMAHASLCEKVDSLEKRVRALALKDCLRDVKGLEGK